MPNPQILESVLEYSALDKIVQTQATFKFRMPSLHISFQTAAHLPTRNWANSQLKTHQKWVTICYQNTTQYLGATKP